MRKLGVKQVVILSAVALVVVAVGATALFGFGSAGTTGDEGAATGGSPAREFLEVTDNSSGVASLSSGTSTGENERSEDATGNSSGSVQNPDSGLADNEVNAGELFGSTGSTGTGPHSENGSSYQTQDQADNSSPAPDGAKGDQGGSGAPEEGEWTGYY